MGICMRRLSSAFTSPSLACNLSRIVCRSTVNRPLGQFLPATLGIRLVLEAEHDIIREPDDNHVTARLRAAPRDGARESDRSPRGMGTKGMQGEIESRQHSSFALVRYDNDREWKIPLGFPVLRSKSLQAARAVPARLRALLSA